MYIYIIIMSLRITMTHIFKTSPYFALNDRFDPGRTGSLPGKRAVQSRESR